MLKTIIPVAVSCELRGLPADEEGNAVTKREGASMFHGQGLSSSGDEDHLQLESQKIINSHKEAKGTTRPATAV